MRNEAGNQLVEKLLGTDDMTWMRVTCPAHNCFRKEDIRITSDVPVCTGNRVVFANGEELDSVFLEHEPARMEPHVLSEGHLYEHELHSRVILETADGKLVAHAFTLPYLTWPDVLVWGLRVFQLQSVGRTGDIPRFREQIATSILGTLEEAP